MITVSCGVCGNKIEEEQYNEGLLICKECEHLSDEEIKKKIIKRVGIKYTTNLCIC